VGGKRRAETELTKLTSEKEERPLTWPLENAGRCGPRQKKGAPEKRNQATKIQLKSRNVAENHGTQNGKNGNMAVKRGASHDNSALTKEPQLRRHKGPRWGETQNKRKKGKKTKKFPASLKSTTRIMKNRRIDDTSAKSFHRPGEGGSPHLRARFFCELPSPEQLVSADGTRKKPRINLALSRPGAVNGGKVRFDGRGCRRVPSGRGPASWVNGRKRCKEKNREDTVGRFKSDRGNSRISSPSWLAPQGWPTY